MGRYILILALMAGMVFTPGVSAQNSTHADRVVEPRLAALYFRSTWCPPCHILEPNLETALERYDLPLRYLRFDMTDGETSEQRRLAQDAGLIGLYDHFKTQLGSVVLVDMERQQVIEVITARYDSREITQAFDRAHTWIEAQEP